MKTFNTHRVVFGCVFGLVLIVAGTGALLLTRSAGGTAHASPRSDVPYGFWALDDTGVQQAVADVSKYVGFNVVVPTEVPSSHPVKLRGVGVSADNIPAPDLQQSVLDYFPPDWKPGDVNTEGPRIRITQTRGHGGSGSTAQPFDLGVQGWSGFKSADSRDGGPSTYLLSGPDHSFVVEVFSGNDPSFEETLPMLRSLARQ